MPSQILSPLLTCLCCFPALPQRSQEKGPPWAPPCLTTVMAEGSTQAATRQEKSLKSSRISNVLHIKASPKAGKAEASSDPVPTSPLVRPSVLAQGGRQQGAPAPAPSACSMAHPSGVTRRNSAWYQPGRLPARQACSLKKAVKHR